MPRFRWWWIILALIVVALVLTRLWDLGNRSYGHDESIHAWESWKLVTGQGYQHDPVYHGPFGYHMVALVFFLFGITDATARLAPALAGIALVLLALPLRRWLGRAGALAAMLLLTLSPTLMYRSRYFRHDVFLMVAEMVMVVSFFRYLEERKERWLYIIAGALSVAFASKAISFIYGFIFGSFLMLWLIVEWWRTRRLLRDLATFDLVVLLGTLALPQATAVLVKALRFDPLDYSQAGIARAGAAFLVLLALSGAIGLWWKRKAWPICAAIFYSIFIVFYTTLFTNARGAATGMVGMLGYWLSQQAVARGGQPWYYFFFLHSVYEFLPSLMAALGAAFYLVASRRGHAANARTTGMAEREQPQAPAFVLFLIYWGVLNSVVWAWASEKMPWQNMHLVLPLGLLGGWFLGQVVEATDWRKLWQQGAGYLVLLVPVAAFSLLALVATTWGSVRPFSGVTLEQLQVTLRWLLSLALLGIAIALMCRTAGQLSRGAWARVVLFTVVAILAAFTVRSACMVTFINQDYATEFLMYADSTPDTGAVKRELDAISNRLAGDRELKVAYDDESSWPFVWYLRDYKNTTFFTGSTGLSGEPAVVIVGLGNESKVKPQLTGKYLRRQYRLIWWPNQDVYSNLTPSKLWRDLRDPARRKFWWDILFYRKYTNATTSWPYVSYFAFYVRKDTAAQLWDYGPEVAGPGIELPEDAYEKARLQLSAVATWGSYGTVQGQFQYPKAIAVDERGLLYVADSYNHRVQVLDADGTFVREWGSQGNGPGQFQEPWGIAVDGAGSVYVADTWNHRIQKFDAQGSFLTQWGTWGDTAGELGATNLLYGPRAIVFDRDGNLLVADTGNKRILRFSPDGQAIGQWGGAGSGDGQLREPVGLAVGASGQVYVADTWNQRIQKSDAEGSHVAQWPVLGWEGEGVTNKPYLAADAEGNIYATAPEYHRVVKFDASGKVLAVWGQYGSDLSSLNMPTGIAVDAQGQVYVVDSANHRILKYAAVR